MLGCGPADAFALAVRRATERHPEKLGVIEDWAKYQETLADNPHLQRHRVPCLLTLGRGRGLIQ